MINQEDREERIQRICSLWIGIHELFDELDIERVLEEHRLSNRLRDRLQYLLAFINDAVDEELEPRIGPYRHLG